MSLLDDKLGVSMSCLNYTGRIHNVVNMNIVHFRSSNTVFETSKLQIQIDTKVTYAPNFAHDDYIEEQQMICVKNVTSNGAPASMSFLCS